MRCRGGMVPPRHVVTLPTTSTCDAGTARLYQAPSSGATRTSSPGRRPGAGSGGGRASQWRAAVRRRTRRGRAGRTRRLGGWGGARQWAPGRACWAGRPRRLSRRSAICHRTGPVAGLVAEGADGVGVERTACGLVDAPRRPKRLLADRGSDAERIRAWPRERRVRAAIPERKLPRARRVVVGAALRCSTEASPRVETPSSA